MAPFLQSRFSAMSGLDRFRSNKNGSAAIEFAFVAPIFLGLLFAIIEVAIVFLSTQTLETAAQDSSRLIMTGQTQDAIRNNHLNAVEAQAFFKNSLCSRIVALFDCQTGVYIDVRSFPSFSVISSTALNDLIDSNGELIPGNIKFQPGGPGNTVIVRAFFKFPLSITNLGLQLVKPRTDGARTNPRWLVASSAFRNEPFSSPPSP
jgi:Flp pilus assembly protein TadG